MEKKRKDNALCGGCDIAAYCALCHSFENRSFTVRRTQLAAFI